MLRILDGGISLYSPTGARVTETHAPLHPTPAEQLALNAALSTGKPQYSEPFGPAGKPPQIGIFVPFRMDGHLAGVLEGIMRLGGDGPLARIAHTYVGHDAHVFLADADGHIVASPDRQRLLTKLTEPVDRPGINALLRGQTITLQDYVRHGQPILTSIHRSRATGWLIGISQPRSDAFSRAISAGRVIAFGTLALLAAILLVMWLTMRRLMTPLETITEQIRAISQSGHSHGHRIHLTAPPRELAELADGFNEMLEALERQGDEILRRKKHFRALIEDLPDTLAVMDRSGLVTFVNGADTARDSQPGGLTGRPATDYLHPDDYVAGRAAFVAALNQPDGTVRLDCRARLGDGPYRHYETILRNRLDDPDIGGIVLSTCDITERRQAEAAVRLEEQRLRVALECADLIVFTQDLSLRYTWAFNSHFFKDGKFKVGKTDNDLFSPGLAAELIAFRRGVLTSGHYRRKEFHTKEDGQDRYYLHAAQPLRDEAGGIVGLVGAVLETTEQRRTEIMLRHAQRLESLGHLTGGIAHDFNNYLSIITANLECILAGTSADSPLHRRGENALMAARAGAELTDKLLTFGRRHPLQPIPLDLNQALEEFRGILRPVTGPNINLIFDLDPDLWRCQTDAGELQNALVNLVLNACDAMPQGGTLTIATRNKPMSCDRNCGGSGCVELSVRDTGHGMTPEIREAAFDPFFTTKEADQGTGLGLSMVYGFARQSAGMVTIDSEAGRGTTVNVCLPRHLDEVAGEVN
jgi:PAS domain S-box-containing protein